MKGKKTAGRETRPAVFLQPFFLEPAHQPNIELAHVKAFDVLAHQVDHIAVRDAAPARHGEIAEEMPPPGG